MTWWSEEEAAGAFDVYLSIGLPYVRSVDGPVGDADPNTQGSEVAHWSTAVLSIARSILSRGGRIIAGFDPDITPLLWAVGLEYSSARPAELPDDRESAPIVVVIDQVMWQRVRSDTPDPHDDGGAEADEAGILRLYERSFAASLHRSASAANERGRVPVERLDGARISMAFSIWPDANCAGDIGTIRELQHRVMFPAPNRQLPEDWLPLADISAQALVENASANLDHERQITAFPYSFVTHRLLDEWLDTQNHTDFSA